MRVCPTCVEDENGSSWCLCYLGTTLSGIPSPSCWSGPTCQQLERQLQTLGKTGTRRWRGWEHTHGMTGGLLGYEMATAFANGGRLRCSGNGRVERQSRRWPGFGSDRGFWGPESETLEVMRKRWPGKKSLTPSSHFHISCRDWSWSLSRSSGCAYVAN